MNEVNLLPGTSISGNLFLAPMAGYTDFVFRSLCAEFGADLCYTEMVSCEGLARLNKKTAELMKSGSAEKQRGIQLFGVNPDSCFEAAKNAAALNPNIIDFNCGCPVPKVVKTGAGAALMRNLKLLKELVAALKAGTEAAGKKIPISVKIRAGRLSLGKTEIARAHQRLDLHQNGPGPFHGAGDATRGGRRSV